ncbi:hypothetical protein [Brevundimonas sp.]|uniref:hypothetical protein n=1 Tax=Brevundimonas sp. TaxID=1871086 RepID=UPI0028970F4F|nr:hypothetical protein [Brevundimonas sp.]
MTEDRRREIAELKARLERLEREEAAEASQPAPSPGPTSSKSDNWIRYGVGGVLALVVIGVVANLSSKKVAAPVPTVTVAPPELPTAEEIAERERRIEEASTPWRYEDDKDPMTDKLTRWACTTSTNQAHLTPPYSSVSARLCLRQSPRYGLDAIVQLNGDGQILCRSYDGCTVKIRFGDGALQSFSGNSAADHSSNVVFIANAARFVAAVKNAPTTKIQLTFYQAGDQVLEFDTEKLVWPRPAPEGQ